MPTNNEVSYQMKETANTSAYSIVWTVEFMQRVLSPGLVSNICSICELQSDELASPGFWLSLLQTYDNPHIAQHTAATWLNHRLHIH